MMDRTSGAEAENRRLSRGADRPPSASQEVRIERRWFLLARVDHEKFHYFYDKYHDSVRRFILHRTGDRDLAEELTSETFLRALRGLWKFRWQGITFGAWLFRIAVNVVNRHFQREAMMQTSPLVDNEGVLPDPARDQLRIMLDAERENRLRLAMAELEPETQTILVLRYFEGLKIRQISLVTQLPEGTIKARINRSLKKLREYLIDA